MKNKVLIKVIMLEMGESFDCFIPVNEIVWKIKKMVFKSISDLMGMNIEYSDNYVLINKDNSRIYNNNEIVIDTDIRNGTEVYLLSMGGIELSQER